MKLGTAARCLLAAALASAPAIAAAATRPLPTTDGRSASGLLHNNFDIVGVEKRETGTGAIPSGTTEFSFIEEVPLAPRTVVTVAVLEGWDLGFGRTPPPALGSATPFNWDRQDRYLGVARVDVAVVGYVRGAARVRITMRLTDTNGDDPWWGVVRYHLLHLGPPR
jgi:hypothetical protein